MQTTPSTTDPSRRGPVRPPLVRRSTGVALVALLATVGGLATACQPAPTCLGAVATVVGTEKADTLRGTPRADVIAGLGGGDVIDGLAGDDIICGGPGADRIAGGEGADGIDGQAGGDTVDGGVDADSLTDSGPAGETNRLTGGAGDDALRGGLGIEVASYADSPTRITYDGLRGKVIGRGTDTIATSIDAIVGSEQADDLLGGALNEALDGAGGDDLLMGRGGDDRLTGGAGMDRVSYVDAQRHVLVSLFNNKALGEGTDVLVGIENVGGSPYDDSLTGDSGPNIIDGGRGRNTCSGYGGVDTLIRCS